MKTSPKHPETEGTQLVLALKRDAAGAGAMHMTSGTRPVSAVAGAMCSTTGERAA